MSQTINQLIEEIEKLRLDLIAAKSGKAYTDPEVISVSQALDELLDKYQELVLKDEKGNDF